MRYSYRSTAQGYYVENEEGVIVACAMRKDDALQIIRDRETVAAIERIIQDQSLDLTSRLQATLDIIQRRDPNFDPQLARLGNIFSVGERVDREIRLTGFVPIYSPNNDAGGIPIGYMVSKDDAQRVIQAMNARPYVVQLIRSYAECPHCRWEVDHDDWCPFIQGFDGSAAYREMQDARIVLSIVSASLQRPGI